MTNEEAIKMLKSKMDGHTDTSYEWTETVRMAIKALEQDHNITHEEIYQGFIHLEVENERLHDKLEALEQQLYKDISKLTQKAYEDGKKDGYVQAKAECNCTDAISRQAALDDSGLGEFHRYDDYCKMRNYIKSLPPISVVEKVGQWDKTRYRSVDQTGETYDDGNALRCSNCAHCFKTKLLWVKNYCPNCGARMENKNDR